MEVETKLVANIFTRKFHPTTSFVTMLWLAVIYLASWLRLEEGVEWAASGQSVFQQGEWWRAWSAQLVHGDLAHLLANTPLLLLFIFLFQGVYGATPVLLAFVFSGLGNLLVLWWMPPEVKLVGASGVVHFLGAMWVTLHVLLDRRESLRPRFASGLFLLLMLFIPDSWRPDISYSAHFLGFILGAVVGWLYYLVMRGPYQALEVYETRMLPPIDFDWQGDVNSPHLPPEKPLST